MKILAKSNTTTKMKTKAISIIAVSLTAIALTVTVFLLKDNDNETVLPPSDSSAAYSSESRQTVLGEKLERCAELIQSGRYSLTVTRNKQIGGLSMPITTYTYYGDGFISITEYEGHDIVTEIFINADGAYYLNSDLNAAYLMPTSTVTPDCIDLEGLIYTESGSTVAGTSAYEYERYINADGETIDYLFAGDSLEKMKLYNGNGYELISIKLSDDIGAARTDLPEGITVTDRR